MSFQIKDVFKSDAKPELAVVAFNGSFLVENSDSTEPKILFEHSELNLITDKGSRVVLGSWHDRSVTLVLGDQLSEKQDRSPAEFITLREMLPLLSAEEIALTTRASQLSNWLNKHQFCGVCGSNSMELRNDSALACGNCDNAVYPRLSPCVIGVVTKGQEILLARGVRHKSMYSCLAGFIEAGESAEQAFEREVFEEVGIRIKNLRYLMSQSWPFPDQLMLGFCAEYAGGELCLDQDEIQDADWYSPKNLPDLPAHFTISRQIIDSVVQGLG